MNECVFLFCFFYIVERRRKRKKKGTLSYKSRNTLNNTIFSVTESIIQITDVFYIYMDIFEYMNIL